MLPLFFFNWKPLGNVTGQLLAQKITRKGKVILRELDLAASQMQAVGDGWVLKSITISPFLTTATWQVPGCRPQHLLAKCACLLPASPLWACSILSSFLHEVTALWRLSFPKEPQPLHPATQGPGRWHVYTQTMHTGCLMGHLGKEEKCYRDLGSILQWQRLRVVSEVKLSGLPKSNPLCLWLCLSDSLSLLLCVCLLLSCSSLSPLFSCLKSTKCWCHFKMRI